MTEAGKKISEVATQKSTEVYGTVSNKVRIMEDLNFHLFFFHLVLVSLFSFYSLFCLFFVYIDYTYVGIKVKDGELLKGISDQASSVAGMVSSLQILQIIVGN